jgi:MerR family transcriptional regulator, light-induced transcriptional regulator
MLSKITEEQYQTYLSSLLAGDRRNCSIIVDQLIDINADIRDIYINLFQKSMYKIGNLWEFNKISVAVEHLATSITLNMLNKMYPLLFSSRKLDKSVVISCVEGEYHQIGSQLITDIFEVNGWDSYYLGTNTPIDDLLLFVKEKQPDLVGLSLAIYYNMPNLQRSIKALRKKFPEMPILVGGQAFRWGGNEILEEFSHVKFAGDMQELETLIASGSL